MRTLHRFNRIVEQREDLFHDGCNCCACAINTFWDVCEKLSTLYEDKEFYKKVADDCFEVTQNPSYRWDKIAEGFEKAMQELSK